MDMPNTVCVSWIDSLFEEFHDSDIFTNETRLKLLEQVWIKTLSILDDRHEWHVIITYRDTITRKELNGNFIYLIQAWKTVWHLLYDYCNTSSSDHLTMSPSGSSYSSMASTPAETEYVESPIPQIKYMSIIVTNSDDLVVFSSPEKWLKWYKTNVQDIKEETALRWIFMSNHPTPVGSLLPIGSGYILPSGDRVNVMMGWDLKKRLMHNSFGVSGLRWTRDILCNYYA
jgi:hypothetical protein